MLIDNVTHRLSLDKRVELVGLGLYLRDMGILAISDLHIGYEEALAAQGIHIPVSQYPKMKKALDSMIDAVQPEKVVIVGDVKHEFGTALRQEWIETLDLLDFLKEKVREVIVVRGNHDNFLIPILRKKEVPFYDPVYKVEDVLFFHGHKDVDMELYSRDVRMMVMGHEHPAVSLRDELGVKVKFKCFLEGEFEDKKFYVLPVFSLLMSGTEINMTDRENLLSPFLKMVDLDDVEVYVTDLEAGIYYFGPLHILKTYNLSGV